jgi:MFS transporter, ACS family, glucarate transporter
MTSAMRQRVIFFAVTLAVITYVDRVCISQAAPFIRAELGLTAAQMGLAFSAFAWAYALFEIPGGWLGDRIGPRQVLLKVVLFWSLFTAATGYAWNFVSLVLARFFFGMGEAGCFPNLTKTFMLHLSSSDRTRAQAIMWLSARWAGAFTPLLVIWVMSWMSWRDTFVLFGLIGFVWAFFFARNFHDAPGAAAHPTAAGAPIATATQPERTPEPSVPWRRWLRSRTIWLLWVQYFCLTYGWFFYVTWLPTYLKETRGLELGQNAFMTWLEQWLRLSFSADTTQRILVAALAGIPLFFGGIGSIVCGWATPRLVRWTRSVALARRLFACIGFSGAAGMLVTSVYLRDPLVAMLAMGLASFCNDLTMPGSWSTCMDVGGQFAGTLSGSMNMMGSFGAAAAPWIIGVLLDATGHKWALIFWISGIVYFLGGLCWLWIDPVTAMDKPERPAIHERPAPIISHG